MTRQQLGAAGALALLLLAVVVAYAAGRATGEPVSEVVRTRSIELVGAKGTYARISAFEENAGVRVFLLDAKGRKRGTLSFGIAGDQPRKAGPVYLQVAGPEGTGHVPGRISLQVGEQGGLEVAGFQGLWQRFALTGMDQDETELTLWGPGSHRITRVGDGYVRICEEGTNKLLWQKAP